MLSIFVSSIDSPFRVPSISLRNKEQTCHLYNSRTSILNPSVLPSFLSFILVQLCVLHPLIGFQHLCFYLGGKGLGRRWELYSIVQKWHKESGNQVNGDYYNCGLGYLSFLNNLGGIKTRRDFWSSYVTAL